MQKNHRMLALSVIILTMSFGMLGIFYMFDKPIIDAQSNSSSGNLTPDQMFKGTQDFINNAMKNTKAPPNLLPNMTKTSP